MGTSYNPKITSNKLVLNFDMANKKSYSGSGTAWTDLTRNKLSGTLTNSPTYNSSLGGYLSLNGTNQYVNLGTNTVGLDLSDKTIQCWINKTAASSKGIIDVGFDNGGGSYGGWGLWIQSNNKLWWWNHSNLDLLDNGIAITNGAWANVAVTWNNTSKTAIFYVNGNLSSSQTNVSIVEKISTSATFVIGNSRQSAGGSSYFDGGIAQVVAYNRILTANEILQNYNTTKGRFGL